MISKFLFLFFVIFQFSIFSQEKDTIAGFETKIKGEEINYFSPLAEFAPTALLTRANGESEISWNAPKSQSNSKIITYELLIGHSSGTSSDNRSFEVKLNGEILFIFKTSKVNKLVPFEKKVSKQINYYFQPQTFDVNGDVFGKLYITVPQKSVKKNTHFSIKGINQNSRDWLMVFMYQKGFKINVHPNNLIHKKEDKRQLIFSIENPLNYSAVLEIQSHYFSQNILLKAGYNKFTIPAYEKDFIGKDSLLFIFNKQDSLSKIVLLEKINDYTFHIIHHSHNDIGYSHLQTEVEEIQIRNIRTAIKWIKDNLNSKEKPYWHIESLWAVENYLKVASETEKNEFIEIVNNGNIQLSANYANILSGLSQPEELNWMIEYAKILEQKYGLKFSNAMITDIPGITWSGLNVYPTNNIPYLSLGPNYVDSQADKGDRVGGVIKEQGDVVFYWKPDSLSNKKVLVWTAGKGYSFFHGITEKDKQTSWEERISNYCDELNLKQYPYNIIQLRYTKNSDNGPVDTNLCSFIENWNNTYSSPKLKITGLTPLFSELESKYKNDIPQLTGEISPYWEDGAYSTAVEEMENRELSIQTIAMEKYAKNLNKLFENKELFYHLHKNILLFHEHTWGSWCSISDPEIFFTTEQWKVKKQFIDSAKFYYNQLSKKLNYTYNKSIATNISDKKIIDFSIDLKHGGIQSLQINDFIVNTSNSEYKLFEPIYSKGINPSTLFQSSEVIVKEIENSDTLKILEVHSSIPSIDSFVWTYTLNKNQNRLICHYHFNKAIEKNKESLHIAIPFGKEDVSIRYGTNSKMIDLSKNQLPGSNKDFICVENQLEMQSKNLTMVINSPKINLFEIGSIINEDKLKGSKNWKKTLLQNNSVYLYVFNNYWHTNYKAYQEGMFDFEIEISFK
ncbi:MAG: hypothetical protein HYR91_03245 [Flavobacteriia bacterium]|nr:hypothetical protein [Flavobacteriia bacterium]